MCFKRLYINQDSLFSVYASVSMFRARYTVTLSLKATIHVYIRSSFDFCFVLVSFQFVFQLLTYPEFLFLVLP